MVKENFIQNKQIKKIYDLAAKKTIPHALLLESDNKSSGTDVAINISKILLCRKNQNPPCNNCVSCKKIAGSIHPDVEFINPINNQKTIGIDVIRNLKKSAYITPNEGNYKIYIFPNASIITPQAQNAFLKILEEPPKSVIFIMVCSSKLELLSTVISRLTCFKIYSNECEIDDNILSEAKEFNKYLLNRNELEILKITSKFSKNRGEFKKLLQYSKNLIIENYASHNYNISNLSTIKIIKILDTLSNCEILSEKNINIPLLTCYLCSNLISDSI